VRLGCRSVAVTYNDPVIFMEYAIDTAKACHAAGLTTVAVTAGYVASEARREFFAHMDAANVDLKAFTEDFYRTVCGGHLQGVLDTLVYLKRDTSVWFEITTLLIPGENDSDGEIDALTRWVTNTLGSDVPLHFTAFHPDWKMRGYDFAYTAKFHHLLNSWEQIAPCYAVRRPAPRVLPCPFKSRGLLT
jgi:pyruvate formate lyase activating enzyme